MSLNLGNVKEIVMMQAEACARRDGGIDDVEVRE
jgi:hypothetical protein